MESLITLPGSTFLKEEWYEMKLRDEDKRWLRDEISSRVMESIKGELDSFKPHGWRRLTNFLREWGLASTVVIVPISLLGLAGAGWWYAMSRVGNETRFETRTSDKIGQIEGQIRNLKGEIRTNEAASSLQMLKQSGHSASGKSLKEISSNLAEAQQLAPRLPQVWRVTAQFISYKSETSLPGSKSISKMAMGVDCTKGGNVEINGPVITFSRCELNLAHAVGGRGISEIRFVNCVVNYDGGPVPPARMVFISSVFHFDVPNVPPPRGAKMMTLIAESQSLKSIQIPA